mmetsp:Transcript_36551/g.114833  ORF Transcript_36551/g.114833 Transcript_36551/m.114833 type:complete len:256 (-) Transcript_36551:190-957(-)
MFSDARGNCTKLSIFEVCLPRDSCRNRFSWRQSTFGSRSIDICLDASCNAAQLLHQQRSSDSSCSSVVKARRQASSDSAASPLVPAAPPPPATGHVAPGAAWLLPRPSSREISKKSSSLVELWPQTSHRTSERRTPAKMDDISSHALPAGCSPDKSPRDGGHVSDADPGCNGAGTGGGGAAAVGKGCVEAGGGEKGGGEKGGPLLDEEEQEEAVEDLRSQDPRLAEFGAFTVRPPRRGRRMLAFLAPSKHSPSTL